MKKLHSILFFALASPLLVQAEEDICTDYIGPDGIPITGDWNGDGKDDIGVVFQRYWILDLNGNGEWDNDQGDHFFLVDQEGVPVVGDWNADGVDDIGLVNGSNWILDQNGDYRLDGCQVDFCTDFGLSEGQPVVADWNGDGTDDIGLFNNGLWRIDLNFSYGWQNPHADREFTLGGPGDIPVVGDWNGDGLEQAGVYSSGIWKLDIDGNQVFNEQIDFTANLGGPSELPVVGDWIGIGRAGLGSMNIITAAWKKDINANLVDDGCFANLTPEANDDSALVYQDRPIKIKVLSNDQRGVGGVLSVSNQLIQLPANGSVTVLPSGEIQYLPDPGFTGVDQFRYEVVDVAGSIDEANVDVTVSANIAATRSPPVFYRNSLRAGNYRLLRGDRYSLDASGQLPLQSDISDMRQQGFNTLHLYAEHPNCGNIPGQHLAQTMQINDWVKQAGMYLIITIGNGVSACWPANSAPSGERHVINFARDFWYQYAQVFADEPQVIFELYNEPYHRGDGSGFLNAQPSPRNTRTVEAAMFLEVRKHAQNIPVLLYSYGTMHDAAAVDEDFQAVRTRVESAGQAFNNVGIAFHGYAFPRDDPAAFGNLESTIQAIQDAGHQLVMTENRAIGSGLHGNPADCDVPDQTTPSAVPCIEPRAIDLFERQEISWTSFIGINNFRGSGFEQRFQRQIDYGLNDARIVWTADSGTWPARSQPPADGVTLFLSSRANDLWVSTSAMRFSPGTGPVAADRADNAGWERFEIIRFNNRRACLKSVVVENAFPDRKPIIDPRSGSMLSPLFAASDDCLFHTSYEWLKLPDGDFVLRAYHNTPTIERRPAWRYVTVGQNNYLFDAATLVTGSERFALEIE